MRSLEIDQIQLDALREISSIAAGNTATSLSIMLGRKVNITVPKVEVESLENVPESLGGKENVANVVYFSVSGRVPGSIFLILPTPESLRLASALTGKAAAQTGSLDEMGRSALKELGNITTGTYLSAISQVLGLRITHSVPGFASDMLGATLDGILARLSLKAVYVVIVENEFRVEKDVYGTHLIFVPEPEALNIMLKALGVWKK
jgi:chemotaxis protein CheC